MRRFLILTFLVVLSFTAGAAAQRDDDHDHDHGRIKHVLLISIDGMHAVDFANCSHGIAGVNSGAPYCPHLAGLANHGINYTGASTSKPSDSFPGLMTIVSGATPRTLGVYYDVAYDRSLDGPKIQTGNGNGPGGCTAGMPPTGFTTEYEEGIDFDKTKLNGGAPNAGLTDGTAASIDPDKLDRDPANGCAPVFPAQFVRTNTIFGVVHRAGGFVAWSDKHPAYSSVAGQGGILDDFYSPEINSNVIALPGVSTPEGASCAVIRDPNSDLTAWTNSFQNIQCYDTLKVNAVLNWIDGKNHLGGSGKTPNLFGMNFQAVSVGQKLIEGPTKGGYLDAAATPTSTLLNEIQYVDDSIGEMIKGIKDRGLWDDTLIIVTAKHGQSPIDPNLYQGVPGPSGTNGSSPVTLIANNIPGAIPFSESPNNPTGIGSTEDDVSLIWLTNPSFTDQAVTLLEDNRSTWGAGMLFYGPSVALNYNWPGLPPSGDPRTPDIIVNPNIGVTYSGSSAKQMEHGGFAHDDTNVMLLVSNPHFKPRTVYTSVGTIQIAPTILDALGINPSLLDGVRLEGTAALPAVQFEQ
jgi:Type I phosphodiesterase / nucleotide pyrophosphatase